MRLVKMLHLSVPETSYSSSEGEDDFYDANDDPFSSQVTTPRWVPNSHLKCVWKFHIDFHVDFTDRMKTQIVDNLRWRIYR